MQSTISTSQSDAAPLRDEEHYDAPVPNSSKVPCTPNSKLRTTFKSPAPSTKKRSQMHKSPMATTQAKMNNSMLPGITASSDKWAVSPVCSRLRDHISMLNGNSCKERLFLQSPMTNRLGWPLSSPAYDPYKALNLASTAQNTTCQTSKYMNYTPQDGFSEMKLSRGIGESPVVTRRFMEHDPSISGIGLFSSSLKSLEKSEFKNYPGFSNQYHSFRDLLP